MKKTAAKILKILSYVLTAAIVVFIIAVLIVKITGGVPSIFGYNVFVVITPSMSPEIEVGDVIISRLYKPGDPLEVGQVVTYQGSSGSFAGKLVTHRVISVTETAGRLDIVTKGIANDTADPPITGEDVVSVMVHKSAVLTFIHRILETPAGFILLYILPVVLFIILEGAELIKNCRRDRKDSKTDEENCSRG